MEVPDAFLEPDFDAGAAGVRFDSGAVLPALAAEISTALAFFAAPVFGAAFAAVFAVGPAALFTVDLGGLATDFVVAGADFFGAGLSVPEMAFAILPATVLSKDDFAGLTDALDFVAVAAFTDVLLTLFAAALFVADFVTVAVMMPLGE